MVKKFLLISVGLLFTLFSWGQVINGDKIKLSNFIERLYRNSPFNGVKIIDDDNAKYLLSVVVLDPEKYKGNDAIMTKVASVKATSQANTFFNGSSMNAETVIHTTEKSDGTSDVEMVEKITENSIGYVKNIELLTSFNDESGKFVYVYSKLIE